MGIATKLEVERYTALWRNHGRLKLVAREAKTTTVKVRKLLITAGIYTNAQHLRITKLVRHGMRTREIARVTGLGPKVVDSYRPYRDGPFAQAGWGLKKPEKLRSLPIISSSGRCDMQPWLKDRSETLIQAFLSLALHVDINHTDLICQMLPLASQYVPALRSLACMVLGLVPAEPVPLDYGNLTLVDMMVAYQLGRWLMEPWNGGGEVLHLAPSENVFALEQGGMDIHSQLLHDVMALGVAYDMLSELFAGCRDEVVDTLLKRVRDNLVALFSYLRSPRLKRMPRVFLTH